MTSVIEGFLLPFVGLGMIFRPGFRRYVVVPLLLNIVIFGLLAWVGTFFFGDFMDHYLPDQDWLAWLRPLLWIVFALAYAMVMFYSFTIVANLIASPFNGMLAAKVEESLTGERPQGAETSLMASLWPAVRAELGKLVYMTSRMVPLLVLLLVSALVPVLNLVVTVLWILAGFWFLAIEYADYPMANHDIHPKRQRELLKNRRFKTLAFGAGVSAMMLVLGFVAMPAAVAGASIYWSRDLRNR